MTLHIYQHGDGLPVFWHHGTPNIGPPPAPLFPTSDRLGLRWVSYDRPGYGGSTPRPGRTVASAATRMKSTWIGWSVTGLSTAYVLCPLDVLPDFIPVLGWVDDGAAIVAAIGGAVAALSARGGKDRPA